MPAEISVLLVKLKHSAAQLHTQRLLASSVLCDSGEAATNSDEALSSNWLTEALRQANGLESNMPRNDKKAKEPTMLSDVWLTYGLRCLSQCGKAKHLTIWTSTWLLLANILSINHLSFLGIDIVSL